MKTISFFFLFITVIVLGLSAGSMLTEAVVLVSYWRSLPSYEFLIWFKNHDALLTSYFGTLQTGSLIISVLTVAVLKVQKQSIGLMMPLSLIISIVIILTFFIFFKSANASFSAGTIPLEEVPAALASWSVWQWVRTSLGVCAFMTAFLSAKEFRFIKR